jgi:hypothetical protein
VGLEELEEWTRRELEQLARRLGVGGTNELTRSQLVNAIERRRTESEKPGLFRRVISFARSLTAPPPPPREPRRKAEAQAGARLPSEAGPPATDAAPDEPIRTRTLARLLSSQGHHQRALAIYRELVRATPGDVELGAEAEACAVRARETKPAPKPEARELVPSGPDEVVSVGVDATSVLVSWEVSARGMSRAERLLGGEGELTARLVLVVPDPAHVVRTETRERRVERMGEWLVAGLPVGARTTASVGLKAGEAFVSIAHCPVLRRDV